MGTYSTPAGGYTVPGGPSALLPLHPLPSWLRRDPSLAVPMLPDVTRRVMAIAGSPDPSVVRLAELVAKDQVLTSRVLGLANSAYSAPALYISSVRDAIIRLGTQSVRNLVLAVALASKSQDRRVYGERGAALFDHALGTAYLGALVAEAARADASEAFLCGLLHDVGKLVILMFAYQHDLRGEGTVPEREVEQALADHHAAMGARALSRWNLPESVKEPIACHHDLASARLDPRQAAVCALANRLSHRYGFGCAADPDDLSNDPAFTLLRLDAAWLAATDERAPRLVAVARTTLG